MIGFSGKKHGNDTTVSADFHHALMREVMDRPSCFASRC